MEHVVIFDTTLQDGRRRSDSTAPEEKLRLARQLDVLGVDVIETGFPAASDGDFRGVRSVAQEIRRPVIAALARCHDRDIDLAGEALRPAERSRIHVFIATSDIHLQHKLRIGQDECVDRARAAVERASASRTTWNSRPRTRAARTSISSAASSKSPSSNT